MSWYINCANSPHWRGIHCWIIKQIYCIPFSKPFFHTCIKLECKILQHVIPWLCFSICKILRLFVILTYWSKLRYISQLKLRYITTKVMSSNLHKTFVISFRYLWYCGFPLVQVPPFMLWCTCVPFSTHVAKPTQMGTSVSTINWVRSNKLSKLVLIIFMYISHHSMNHTYHTCIRICKWFNHSRKKNTLKEW